ncbi:MAG: helix-turn-helix domain-containing protein, partial [Clostridia bacterium]|nr:helix-turn-helix domain-containing protein [Clostridia bacterium]
FIRFSYIILTKGLEHKMELLKFSKNLREALKNNKKTQQELADYLGTTQATISRWLKGENEPDLATLLKICLYLNETPNEILGYDDISDKIIASYKKQ